MDDQQNLGFEEFESAFSEDGYQTEPEAAEEDTALEPQEEPQEEETPAEANDTEQDAPEAQEAKDEPAQPETFTLKVNKEEKTYTREEMISLAQKGADYDRVKEQLEKARQEQAQTKKTLAVFEEVAKASGITTEQLLENMQIARLKHEGLSEGEAKERIARQKVERELEALKAVNAEKDNRAQKEIAEFRSAYPEVEVTQELIDKLMPEVKDGKSLLAAYRQQEQAAAQAAMKEKQDRIAELERQLAAEKQNKANRAASPGSQKDTGAKRQKSEFEQFETALFG